MKRSTWLILLLFLAALGVFFYFKYQPAKESSMPEATVTPPTPNGRLLFAEEDTQLNGIRIYDKQSHIAEIVRPSGGLWEVRFPATAPANQSQAEAAATQATALEILDTLNPSVTADTVGLEPPFYTIKLTFQGNEQHKLAIGDKTPVGDGYYVRVDSGPIYIIGSSGIDALLNLLSSPPFLATEMPIPSVTTVTPTP